jgi:N-acetylglucosaminyldiphosphoundecaprenol N-acetyl-beta-D-mannosaminyltransferase
MGGPLASIVRPHSGARSVGSEFVDEPIPLRSASDGVSALGDDDLSRNVFGVLGIPLDALDLDTLLARFDVAVREQRRFLLSTPNVNFLMISRSDRVFCESLLLSDVCPVDGMPLVWIARLLGVSISGRLPGSDIFDALRTRPMRGGKLKVFLFGGSEGLAETLGHSINAEQGGMSCVGTLNPGFGSISDMSADAIVHRINASGADFLTVFLSAQKAQGWLLQNYDRLDVPVRAQLGATINLQVGRVRRAPRWLQRMGFEWLWRVKEEPFLWRRYFEDGCRLLGMVLTHVLPLSANYAFRALTGMDERQELFIERCEEAETVRLKLSGAATALYIDSAIGCFRHAIAAKKAVVVDISQVTAIDPRFFGLLLMLRKQLLNQRNLPSFVATTPRAKRLFRMNGFGFLLNQEA